MSIIWVNQKHFVAGITSRHKIRPRKQHRHGSTNCTVGHDYYEHDDSTTSVQSRSPKLFCNRSALYHPFLRSLRESTGNINQALIWARHLGREINSMKFSFCSNILKTKVAQKMAIPQHSSTSSAQYRRPRLSRIGHRRSRLIRCNIMCFTLTSACSRRFCRVLTFVVLVHRT